MEGLWINFIDNRKGAVFNGSDLGKEHLGQVLIKRLKDYKTIGKEVGNRIYSETSYTNKPDWMIGDFKHSA